MPSAKPRLGPAGLCCLLLVLVTWAVYLPIAGFDFTNYDDPDYVTKNPPVRAGLTAAGVTWAFTHSHSANWHPLTWISHMLDCQLFGLHAGGHHLTNLLLHTANTLLLFALLRLMTGAIWRSGLVAALFALHPMHVESVAWVAERKDVLSTFFGLLTLWAYVRYVQEKPRAFAEASGDTPARVAATGDAGRKSAGHFYGLALIFYALGLMSKPMIVTLPFVMLLLDYGPLRRGQESKTAWKGLLLEKVPFLALAAASCLVTILVQASVNALAPLEGRPLSFRLANVAVCYVLYLWKLVWPTRLAVLYPEVSHWSPLVVLLALGILGTITALVVWQRKDRPWLAVGWAWFLGTLVPVIGLVKVGSHSIADRYTYLPAIGVFITAVWGFGEWLNSPGRRRALLAAATAVLITFAMLTQAQVGYWRNTQTLFRHTLAVTTNNYIAHTSLAFDLVERKQPAEAEEHLRASLAINPAFEPAWTKLATLLVDEGKLDEAIGYCQTALKVDPRSAGAHSTWGLALIKQGQTNAALAQYAEALRVRPEFADAHYNLANTLANQGQIESAREHYEASLRSDPYSADAHNNLAYMLVREGKLDAAAVEFQAALALQPDFWQARYGLGDALVRQGKYDLGAWQLSRVLQAQPDLLPARLQYGIALASQGLLTDAAEALAEAVRQKPGSALAHYQLALVQSQLGKAREAVPHFREALRQMPNSAAALDRLAWLLAVSPDPEVRNGTEAVQLAERACQLSNFKQPAMLQTLAAAYAERGRFAEAVSTAEKACNPALAAKEFSRKCDEMLALFRAGQPYRETNIVKHP